MAITFDSVNKWVLLPNVTSITAQEIYNVAVEWSETQEGMDDLPPLLSTGFAPLGGGAYSDKIFILNSGWKLKPYSGTYTLTIIGTIITDDESPREVPPDSGTVHFVYQVTSQGIISVTGSGVTQQDKQDIADLVETQTGQPIKTKVNPLPADPAKESTVTDIQVQTTNIELHHIGRVKMEGDYLYIYDTLNQLIAKYKLNKDSEGRIIERVPQEL